MHLSWQQCLLLGHAEKPYLLSTGNAWLWLTLTADQESLVLVPLGTTCKSPRNSPAFAIPCHAYAVLAHSAEKPADLLWMGKDGDSQHRSIIGSDGPTSIMAGAESSD